VNDVLCEELSEALAATVDGEARLGRAERRHVERCLRCQAEVVQYRKLLRAMRQLRTEVIEPAPGLLAEILAGIEEAGERHAIRSVLSGRRIAYLGGLAAATAAGAAGALVFATRSRRTRLAG
jgi:anti-sigma factor RsiW